MINPPLIQNDKHNQYSGYFLVVAWIITITIIILIAKTRVGYALLYLFVIASIVLVLAVGSPTIATIFNNAKSSQ